MSIAENEIFPGRYRNKRSPTTVVRVTQVKGGLVSVKSTDGPPMSALLGASEFMATYEKIK